MKNYRIVAAALFALLAVSCGTPSARIDGNLTGASEKEVIVKLLDASTYNVLDTVKTDASGHFSYKVPVKEGQPEFVYLFYGDTKISSLLLKEGDAVKVTADTLGYGSVEGSEESTKLQEVERNFAKFLSEAEQAETNAELNRIYVRYYRDAVKYVMTNPYSLTVVPVLFQKVSSDFPVFSQTTDAIHFRNAVDSLKTVFPESRYVKALEKEAVARENVLGLNSQLQSAKTMDFPDIKSVDVNGKPISLSEVEAKAVLISFWTVTDAATKITNVDSLLPLYEAFHDKGFEIFAVSLDTDKAAWASVVKSQNLPWINVNDGLGTASNSIMMYNVSSLPQNYLLLDGKLYDKPLNGTKEVERVLAKALK